MEIKKNVQSMYQAKWCEEKYVDLLLIGEERKTHYVLIKDLVTFMYHHKLHHGKNHFCCSYLKVFSVKEI